MTVCVVLLTCSCGGFDFEGFDSLLGDYPRVVSVEPVDGATVNGDMSVAIEFSKPVSAETVDSNSLAVTMIEIGDKGLYDIAWDVVDGKRPGMDGVYEVGAEGLLVIFRPATPYIRGAKYAVIVTGKVKDIDMRPLNQRPGTSPTPFVSTFTVEQTGIETEIEGRQNGSTGAVDGGDPVSEEAAAELIRPSWLVINELLYDAAGSDTDGDVFIELAGEAGGEIGGYKINLVNGDDGAIKDSIELPPGSSVQDDSIFLIADSKTGVSDVSDVADADLIDNFDPQNGPDCVQLLDADGNLLDALGYGTPIAGLAENGLACYEGTPAPKTGSGKSLSRTDGADSGDNSADFVILDSPSPGYSLSIR